MKKLLLFLMAFAFLTQSSRAQTASGLHFDGQISGHDYITVPDDNSLDFTTNFTFEAWVNFDQITRTTNSYDWQCLFAKSTFNSSYGLMLLTEGANRLRFYHTGFGSGFTDYVWSLSAGTWYHIAVSLSSTKATIYINGVEVNSQTSTGSLTANSLNLIIGASDPSTPYPIDGQMDDVRFWNTTRSITEISTNMNCQLSGMESGLVLNFDFDQGTVNSDNTSITSVTDKSSISNNGTLNGFALTSTIGNFIDASSNGVSGNCTLNTENFDNAMKDISIVPTLVNHNSFRIQSENTEESADLFIYNVTGQLVKKISKLTFNTSIDISELNKGLYFVKIQIGNKSISKKLLKI